MEQISRIGMDTSKHLFQLHGVDAAEKPVLRRALRRRDMITFFERLAPTRVAIEACGASHTGRGCCAALATRSSSSPRSS